VIFAIEATNEGDLLIGVGRELIAFRHVNCVRRSSI
jgi:hypothetical protein